MHFMNDGDIAMAVQRHAPHTILGRAARCLDTLKEETDSHSDGWCYWPLPCRAANKLITLIEAGGNPTEADLRRALAPIKAFYTKRGDAAGMRRPAELAAAGSTPSGAAYASKSQAKRLATQRYTDICASRDDAQSHIPNSAGFCVFCGAPK